MKMDTIHNKQSLTGTPCLLFPEIRQRAVDSPWLCRVLRGERWARIGYTMSERCKSEICDSLWFLPHFLIPYPSIHRGVGLTDAVLQQRRRMQHCHPPPADFVDRPLVRRCSQSIGGGYSRPLITRHPRSTVFVQQQPTCDFDWGRDGDTAAAEGSVRSLVSGIVCQSIIILTTSAP